MKTTLTVAEALTAQGCLAEVLDESLSAERRELHRIAAFYERRLAARLERTLMAHLMAVEMRRRKVAAFHSKEDEQFYELATKGSVTYRIPVDSEDGSSLPRSQGGL